MEKQAYIMCDYSLLFRLTDEKHGSKIIEKAGAMIDTFHCRQKNNAVIQVKNLSGHLQSQSYTM